MYGTGAARPPIQRNSLREQIADALREEMMAGRLAAGRNFTVKEIADLYGVSATPAREAMVDLAAQGLLRTEHHRGFTVPAFTWRDFVEIFEARTLLTDSAMRRLTAHPARGSGGYDWSRMPSLRRRADAAARASRQGQLDVLVGCDLRFWQEAAALLGNARIADYLGWLRVQSWMFAAPYLRQVGDLGGVCWDRHGDLVDRIEARDLSGAHRVVNDYNLFTLELLGRLAGEETDAVPVAALLRAPLASASESGPQAAAPAPAVPAAPAAPAEEATRVPPPRSVPPGRFGRPVRPSGPVPGRTSPS
ncbi:GntR family transcriptional regulator [Kitasatospora sp. NPDC093679]|uniref:GntR family transcriptional regulator n=1 Tax=Kitasatospora sp. NPDC093679 TaxID=3154983 RepID=UPI00341356CC